MAWFEYASSMEEQIKRIDGYISQIDFDLEEELTDVSRAILEEKKQWLLDMRKNFEGYASE